MKSVKDSVIVFLAIICLVLVVIVVTQQFPKGDSADEEASGQTEKKELSTTEQRVIAEAELRGLVSKREKWDSIRLEKENQARELELAKNKKIVNRLIAFTNRNSIVDQDGSYLLEVEYGKVEDRVRRTNFSEFDIRKKTYIDRLEAMRLMHNAAFRLRMQDVSPRAEEDLMHLSKDSRLTKAQQQLALKLIDGKGHEK